MGLVLLAAPGLAAEHEAGSHDPDVIHVVSSNVQGKNVFIPSTIVVEAKKGQTLSIFNTTDTPHGFEITKLGVQFVLDPQKETEVKLPAAEEGIYTIHCQLHPPHRNARLVVLEID